MKQHNYKNLPVSLIHCDTPEIYEDLILGLEPIFADVNVEATVEQCGEGLTTCRVPGTLDRILNLPNSEKFYTWLKDTLIEYSELLIGRSASSVSFKRAWANKMFKGSEGRSHQHRPNCHGVAIFYLKVPENGAKLTLIKGYKIGARISDYREDQCFEVVSGTGDLVIHHPIIPHAVSTHNSDEERICLVFEFVYN